MHSRGFQVTNLLFRDPARPYAPLSLSIPSHSSQRAPTTVDLTQSNAYNDTHASHLDPVEKEKRLRSILVKQAIGSYCAKMQSKLGGTLGDYLTKRDQYYQTRDYFLGVFFHKGRTRRVNYLLMLAEQLQNYAKAKPEQLREQFTLLEITLNKGINQFSPRAKDCKESLRPRLKELLAQLQKHQTNVTPSNYVTSHIMT